MNEDSQILYVEDDPDIRAVTEMALEDEGFELTLCESGQQALEQAKQESHFDLLLLDVMMPGMDGPATLLKLREYGHLVNTPVIFMTAKVQPAEIDKYKAMGAIGVISKPYDPMTLAEQIRDLLKTVQLTEKIQPNKQQSQPNKQHRHAKLLSIQEQFSQTLADRLTQIKLAWQDLQQQFDPEQFKELVRNSHSLGGSGATFGYTKLGKQALLLEALLLDSSLPFANDEETLKVEQAIHRLDKIAAQGPDREISYDTGSTDRFEQHNQLHDNGFSIFMLEDDIGLAQETVKQLLNFDYHVRQFNTLADIKAAIKISTPDALLFDINLQEGRNAGSEFATQLRAEGLPDVPIIFMSGYDAWQDRLNAVKANGKAFLSKPVNFDELAEILDQLSGRAVEPAYRVLIVDDTVLLSEHYAQVLKSAGMETSTLSDPQYILSRIAEFRPDLVLMDIFMPECNGIEVTRVIRQHNTSTNVPIVYLSTEKSLKKQLDALEVGGDDFLQKPIDEAHLVTAVTHRVKRFRQLNALMNNDSMTGLVNHLNLKLFLEREIKAAQRRSSEVSFVMLDIDHFKAVNDLYGHPTGDRVIKSLARLLKYRLRTTDISARYGGEEFAIILPDTPHDKAMLVIDDIRTRFAEIEFTHNGKKFSVTLSGGIASSEDTPEMSALIATADEALYRAKDKGRNRIELS
jgi:diguanylate cyclase (GGDEF)-like protein